MDKTVLRIHDGRLAVLARLLLDVLQKFDSEVAGGIALAQVDLLLEVLLHVADAVLDLVTVVDMDMA